MSGWNFLIMARLSSLERVLWEKSIPFGWVATANFAAPTESLVRYIFYMGVSKNNGTPKSSILIGFSIINHPFWGTPIIGNTHIQAIIYCDYVPVWEVIFGTNGSFRLLWLDLSMVRALNTYLRGGVCFAKMESMLTLVPCCNLLKLLVLKGMDFNKKNPLDLGVEVLSVSANLHPGIFNSSPLKIGRDPKRKGSSSNHHFSGANCWTSWVLKPYQVLLTLTRPY